MVDINTRSNAVYHPVVILVRRSGFQAQESHRTQHLSLTR